MAGSRCALFLSHAAALRGAVLRWRVPAVPLEPSTSGAAPDPAAWLEAHGDYLFSYAMLRVRNTAVAEDLVQESLLAALQRLNTFQHRSSVRTWLVGILKHKLADHFARAGVEQARGRRAEAPHQRGGQASEQSLGQWLESQFNRRGKWVKPPGRWGGAAPLEPQALAPAERDELRRTLAECLERLPPKACEAIVLRERSNMPAEKIGKVLDISTTNVGVLLFRARTALRHCLELRWFGGGKGARGA